MSRPRFQLRPPLNLLLALVCFLALDAAIFKSGLYARIAAPGSMAGQLLYTVRDEAARPRAGSVDEALVVGDSKIAEGFAPAAADEWIPNAPLRLISGASPGISLRGMYYLLRRLDAKRDRYRMIVVPLYFYEGFPLQDQLDERFLDAEMMAPILGLSDYLDFARSFPDRALVGKALLEGFVRSASFAADVRDLVAHPQQRRVDVAWRNHVADRAAYLYAGRPEDMRGLAFDPTTHTIRYPSRLTAAQRQAVASYFERLPEPAARQKAAEVAAYVHEWAGRIVADYRGTRTTVVFIRMPEGPTPLPRLEPPPGAPSLVAGLAGRPGVEVVDGSTFASLERPEYYFDMLHFNVAGRTVFSRKLLEVLLHLPSYDRTVPASPAHAPAISLGRP
jgi:hypothetical protein